MNTQDSADDLNMPCHVLWASPYAARKTSVSTEWRAGLIVRFMYDRAGTLRALIRTTTPRGAPALTLQCLQSTDAQALEPTYFNQPRLPASSRSWA